LHTSTERSTASLFHGNSPVHKSGDTYTKIYYFIMPENCGGRKKERKKKKVYQDVIEIRKNLSK
jgi:hypothetical protein